MSVAVCSTVRAAIMQQHWSFNAGIPLYARVGGADYERLGGAFVTGLTLRWRAFLNTASLLPWSSGFGELPDKDIWSWTGYTWEEMMLETEG